MIICTKDTRNSGGRDMQKLFPIKRTERIFILREKSKDARRMERFVLLSLFLSLSLLVSRYLARERISNIFCNIAQFRYVT